MKKTDILIAGIFICLLYSYFCVTKELSKSREISSLQTFEISLLRDSVNTIVDKHGQLTFQVASADIEKKQLKDALKLAGYDIRQLREREVEYRRINALLKARLEATGSITSTVRDTFTVV